MYQRLKKLIVPLIPRSLLFRLEPHIRAILFIFYAGKAKYCNLCQSRLRTFIDPDGDMICPRCGGIARNRRLFDLLNSQFLSPGISILDFSPSRSLYRILKKGDYRYTASDLSGDFLADVNFDITDIEMEAECYDLILCYHVLEHVPDDTSATNELFRVLKKGGHCLIQTPFRDGPIYEDPAITDPVHRKQHFGQEDHVRIYSAEGLRDRLQRAGFSARILNFNTPEDEYLGLKNNERILLCRKAP